MYIVQLHVTPPLPYSRELETQAEEIEEAYEKRMHNLQKSMKKQFSRKRRRRDDDGVCGCEILDYS